MQNEPVPNVLNRRRTWADLYEGAPRLRLMKMMMMMMMMMVMMMMLMMMRRRRIMMDIR